MAVEKEIGAYSSIVSDSRSYDKTFPVSLWTHSVLEAASKYPTSPKFQRQHTRAWRTRESAGLALLATEKPCLPEPSPLIDRRNAAEGEVSAIR